MRDPCRSAGITCKRVYRQRARDVDEPLVDHKRDIAALCRATANLAPSAIGRGIDSEITPNHKIGAIQNRYGNVARNPVRADALTAVVADIVDVIEPLPARIKGQIAADRQSPTIRRTYAAIEFNREVDIAPVANAVACRDTQRAGDINDADLIDCEVDFIARDKREIGCVIRIAYFNANACECRVRECLDIDRVLGKGSRVRV